MSLGERIDLISSAAGLVFHVFGTIAHSERRLIAERPYDGLQPAQGGGLGWLQIYIYLLYIYK
jgi:hypothetical protein